MRVEFSDSIVTVCTTIFFFIAILPAVFYGAFVGRRILKRERKSNWLRRLFVPLIFAIIGGAIFPITITIMINNWEHLENDLERSITKVIRALKRWIGLFTR